MPAKADNCQEQKRDNEIFKEIKEIYKLEWQRADKLNDKAISIVTSAGTIMALYVGLGTFILDRVSRSNAYYPWLISVLMFGLLFFILAILNGLFGYGVARYKATDPEDFVKEYESRGWSEFVHYYGGDLKNAIAENRTVNDAKVKRIRFAMSSLTVGTISILLYALVILLALGANL